MPEAITRGTIVLVPFPFTDLSSEKMRPAVVISNERAQDRDVCVAFITSQIPSAIPADGLLIEADNPGFSATGLKTASMIRAGKIATLDCMVILGELGKLSPKLIRELDRTLTFVLGL